MIKIKMQPRYQSAQRRARYTMPYNMLSFSKLVSKKTSVFIVCFGRLCVAPLKLRPYGAIQICLLLLLLLLLSDTSLLKMYDEPVGFLKLQ